MRARSVAAAAAAVLAGAGLAQAQGQEPRANGSGQFVVQCKFSHRASDDPIVKPGQAGGSHSHDFVGNRSTSASSTLETLSAAQTNCHRGADRSGYWAPTLSHAGRELAPIHAQIYYRTAGRDPASIKPFPAGLKLVAGDAGAAGPQPRSVVAWGCRGEPAQRARPPLCAGRRGRLKLTVRLPECWDGRALDSPDHQSHMAYAQRVRKHGLMCPGTHPVAVPKIVLNLIYPTRGGRLVTLSSGSALTAHADFFNAWEPAALAELVRDCLNAARHCGRR